MSSSRTSGGGSASGAGTSCVAAMIPLACRMVVAIIEDAEADEDEDGDGDGDDVVEERWDGGRRAGRNGMC